MRKIRACFVIFAILAILLLSCGIPTSMPVLPKEVAVKVEPSLSAPLGRVNYNLYSGLNGEALKGNRGSLDDLLGDSWLTDLQDKGVTIYDYRPPNGDDSIQTFLVRYKLDMKETMGWDDGGFDLTEYQDKLDELTKKETDVEGMEFPLPDKVDIKQTFDIPMSEVTKQVTENITGVTPVTAFLPVNTGSAAYDFPDNIPREIMGQTLNKGNLFVTLPGLDSLTLYNGKLKFNFTLHYGILSSSSVHPPGAGSQLELSNFRLRKAGSTDFITGVAPDETGPVVLNSNGATGSCSIVFDNAVLPEKFDLVCRLTITGVAPDGAFTLIITPTFEEFTISGVSGLKLSETQAESLACTVSEDHSIGGNLGPSFSATVGVGSLYVNTNELFPPIDPAKPGEEGWNLALDLSKLKIEQESLADAPGLSISGLDSGNNDLAGEKLNRNDVKISGKATASLPGPDADRNYSLTFCNLREGGRITKAGMSNKQVEVRMNVSRLSEVKVKPEDFGLKDDFVAQKIEQDLSDLADFKEWINYIQFSNGEDGDTKTGLGVVLDIDELNMVGGLALYMKASTIGLDTHAPLENIANPAAGDEKKAELIFVNRGHKLLGSDLPDKGGKLSIDVELGLEDATAQQIYEDTGLLTLKDVELGQTLVVEGAKASLVFDWTEMSVIPKSHTNVDDDPLPTYPFEKTFPETGEDEIDMSEISERLKGLEFYTPKTGKGVSGQLYISLKRQKNIGEGETEDWVPDDDPGSWGKDMQVNLPNLEFYIWYGGNVVPDDVNSDLENRSVNLFKPEQRPGTSSWTLPRSIGEILEDMHLPKDTENKDNPFALYTAASLPEPARAIPLVNLEETLNTAIQKGDPLSFGAKVELMNPEPGKDGEILLYPDMLKKKIVASVDLLMLVPMIFRADPDATDPVTLTLFDRDLEEDLFRRETKNDNAYFDRISSFGFDIVIKNGSVLSAGELFLENKTDKEDQKYRLPLVDFTSPRSHLTLDGGEIERIKKIYPFKPKLAIEFKPGTPVQIKRNFNVELQSVTVRAGSEFTIETGL